MAIPCKISASILNADFFALGQTVSEIIPYIDEIHFDVMDGNFVENISMGIPVIEALRPRFPETVFDVHLMINDPDFYWQPFAKAGSDIVVFHYEATTHSYINLKKIKDMGKKAGIALNPATDVSLLEPVKEYIDRVLVMTVEPGFGGQAFIPEMCRKIEKARKMFGDNLDIEVDGGINGKTIVDAKNAGANVFVVGSFIFAAPDKAERVRELRKHF